MLLYETCLLNIVEEKNGIREIDFQEAVELLESGRKFVWLGKEPADYIARLLELDAGIAEKAEPQEIFGADRFRALEFSDCIFVCYHGNTSRAVAKLLKDRHNVESYSLKGGVTAVVGEIF